ncbi:MAG: YfiR family protein [Bacteroidales bacterium]|nr:YfiR family protein [Bacteroidales bacterium]
MKRIILVLISLLIISINSFSQNEKLKAVFMYNFSKYISWPNNSGDFIIGVMGSSEMISELNIIAQKRKVGNRTIKVLDFSSYENIKNCNILYISDSKKSQLSKSILKVSLQPVVVVSDSPGSINKGAGINFVIDDGKQKFEIKKQNVEKNGIVVNSALLNLGIKK